MNERNSRPSVCTVITALLTVPSRFPSLYSCLLGRVCTPFLLLVNRTEAPALPILPLQDHQGRSCRRVGEGLNTDVENPLCPSSLNAVGVYANMKGCNMSRRFPCRKDTPRLMAERGHGMQGERRYLTGFSYLKNRLFSALSKSHEISRSGIRFSQTRL